jgi:hypothetical protein
MRFISRKKMESTITDNLLQILLKSKEIKFEGFLKYKDK